MPWLILFGLGAYLLWKEREKITASAPAATPIADTMTAPPPDAPQDAPQDGGAPAPQDGASGGGGYADPGPTGPAPAPTPAPGMAIHTPLMQFLTQEKHAEGITQGNVQAIATRLAMPLGVAPAPAPETIGTRGLRVPHDPTVTPAPIPASPTTSVVTAASAAGRKSIL